MFKIKSFSDKFCFVFFCFLFAFFSSSTILTSELQILPNFKILKKCNSPFSVVRCARAIPEKFLYRLAQISIKSHTPIINNVMLILLPTPPTEKNQKYINKNEQHKWKGASSGIMSNCHDSQDSGSDFKKLSCI